MKIFINGATAKLRKSAADTGNQVVTYPASGAHYAGHPVGTLVTILDGVPVEGLILCKIGCKQHFVSVECIDD